MHIKIYKEHPDLLFIISTDKTQYCVFWDTGVDVWVDSLLYINIGVRELFGLHPYPSSHKDLKSVFLFLVVISYVNNSVCFIYCVWCKKWCRWAYKDYRPWHGSWTGYSTEQYVRSHVKLV